MILLSGAEEASQSQHESHGDNGEDRGSAAPADGQVDEIGAAIAGAPASAGSFPRALFDWSKIEAYRQQLSKWVLPFPRMLTAHLRPQLNHMGLTILQVAVLQLSLYHVFESSSAIYFCFMTY